MQPKDTQPICPACGYDLTGLIAPGSEACCPECNTTSKYDSATKVVSRWPMIRLAALLLLAVPMLINAMSYFMLSWSLSGLDAILFMFLHHLMHLYLPATTTVLLIVEWRGRHRALLARHYKPAGWISMLLILLPASLSMWASYHVFMLWGAAMASI